MSEKLDVAVSQLEDYARDGHWVGADPVPALKALTAAVAAGLVEVGERLRALEER